MFMRTTTKLQLLALSGLMLLFQPAQATESKKKSDKPAAAKYCPAELTKAQIMELVKEKKVTIGDKEFQVGPRFNDFAGKRYTEMNEAKKVSDTIVLKHERMKGEKTVCLYTYAYKKKKEDSDKEVDRTGRIRIFTTQVQKKAGDEKPAAEKK
jgi:hypothetical protein